MNLMIVDDEQQIRNGLADTINWKEYGIEKVIKAENGLTALDAVRKNRIDVMITDVRMPGLNGLELSARVKDVYPDVKIILLTGYSEFEYAKKAIKIGVDEYFLKPVRIGELVGFVSKLCKSIELERNKNDIYKRYAAEEEKVSWFIEKCKKYIEDNYSDDIGLEELSGFVGRNASYISHVFKKETGKCFSEYLNELRVKKAIELMKVSTMMVYEIADNVGFGDYRHFNHVFKKITGKSPKEYKNRNASG